MNKLHLRQVTEINMTGDKSRNENGTIILAEHPAKHLANTLQSHQSHQKQGTAEKLSLEKPKETWQVDVMWDLGWGPGTETGQGHQVKSIDFSY